MLRVMEEPVEPSPRGVNKMVFLVYLLGVFFFLPFLFFILIYFYYLLWGGVDTEELGNSGIGVHDVKYPKIQ